MKNVFLILCIFSCNLAHAGAYEDGWAAYWKKDYVTAMRTFKSLAAQGSAEAQASVALMYENGLGVLQDYREAAKWHRLAAKQGDVQSQAALALMYENGLGVTQSLVHAHMWYNFAASKGDSLFIGQRRDVELKMTAQQIEQAQRLARECMSSKFTKCD